MNKVAILPWATDPAPPYLCGMPFFHAAAAGAMNAEIEAYFTSKSVRLLEQGVAGQAGAAAWMGRCMDNDSVTLVYGGVA
jgi:predicted peroxiredoxin